MRTAASGSARLLPASAILLPIMPVVRPISFSGATTWGYRILGIVDGTKRNRPDKVRGRRHLRQARHALEDRWLTGKAEVPVRLNRSKRRAIIIETRLGGRTAGVVPCCPAMTGDAGRLRDEAILGNRIAETDVQSGIVREIGLRSLQTIIGKH